MTEPGPMAAERAALLEGAALLDRTAVGALRIGGLDRQRFLQGLVTCDLSPLAEGDGAYGFLTTVQGKVLADLVVLALADDLWLELPPGADEEVTSHLGKYLIADRVEIAALGAIRPVGLTGPRATAILEAEVGPGEVPAASWQHRPLEIAGRPVRVVRRGIVPGDSFDLWLAAGDVAAVSRRLREAGAIPVGAAAAEIVRVERGIPAFGRDFGRDNFPQETGLDELAVSYEKGCYLGQEVVARIHYRGGVNRLLRGLRFRDVDVPPAAGTPLLAEGRPAGEVSSPVVSPVHGAIALAILHKRANSPGSLLELEAGGRAEVAALPF